MIRATANCTNLSRDHFLGLATASRISAGVCLSLTILILLIVVFVRAFESFLQRLFVCLTAITVWYLSVMVMHTMPYTSQFCAALGFLNQWAGISVLIFTFVVALVIVCRVCELDICSCINSQTGRNKKLIEAAFILFLIVLPLLFIWIPFLNGTYGNAGGSEPWLACNTQ